MTTILLTHDNDIKMLIVNHSNRYMCNILERCDLLYKSFLQINIDICGHIVVCDQLTFPSSLPATSSSLQDRDQNWAVSPLHSSLTTSREQTL